MRRTGNRSTVVVVASLVGLAAIGIACGRGGRGAAPAAGVGAGSSGGSEPSAAFLEDETQTAQLAIQALDIYRRDHPGYPFDAAELIAVVPEVDGSGGQLFGGWDYSGSGGGYTLRRVLRGNHALVYTFNGSSGTWEFHPSGGSPRPLQ